MLLNHILINRYPFNKNYEKYFLLKCICSIIKIQRWYKYYHIPHYYFHTKNCEDLVLTRYNIIKLLSLYLKYPDLYFFKYEPIFYYKNTYKCNCFEILYSNSNKKYKMYVYLKKLDYDDLKNLYFYIKHIK